MTPSCHLISFIRYFLQGISKRGLLREILPIMGTNLKLQRLYTEYEEQLEMVPR